MGDLGGESTRGVSRDDRAPVDGKDHSILDATTKCTFSP